MRILLLAVFLLGFSIIPAFADELETSQLVYLENEIITISGSFTPLQESKPVVIQIFYNNDLIEIAQLSLAADGSFTHTLSASGPLWANDGIYDVTAKYDKTLLETFFGFAKNDSVIQSAAWQVDAGPKGTFDIDFTIDGASIKDVIYDPNTKEMDIMLDAKSDGFIVVAIPDGWVDSENILSFDFTKSDNMISIKSDTLGDTPKDITAPQVNELTITSDGDEPTIAAEEDTVRITIGTDENILNLGTLLVNATSLVQINGLDIEDVDSFYFVESIGDTTVIEFEVDDGSILKDGSITFDILIEDTAGNTAKLTENDITDGSFVIIKNTADAIAASSSSEPEPLAQAATIQPQEEIIPETVSEDIPEWVRGVFVFWADGQISDDDLKNAIKFLVNNGIIILE